jgi:hypothetical protein
VKEGEYDGCILFLCMGTMKPVEIVLRRQEKVGGVDLIKKYYKHTCKGYNISPCTAVRKNKNFKKNLRRFN